MSPKLTVGDTCRPFTSDFSYIYVVVQIFLWFENVQTSCFLLSGIMILHLKQRGIKIELNKEEI